MKKFIAGIITILYMTIFSLPCFAGELYYLQNAHKSVVLPLVQNSFNVTGYTIKNSDPIYGIKENNEVVAILQESDNDTYYYIDNTTDKTLTKKILSSLKNSGYKYKKITNEQMSLSFAQTTTALKKSMSKEVKKYDFSETKTYNKYSNPSQENTNQDTLSGYVSQVPVGTTFEVYLQNTINTATAQKGDEVIAILTKNWVYNGHIIAEQGSKVIGSVSKANSAGMAYRDGKVKFNFRQIQTPSGKIYNITTEDIEFQVDSDGKGADAAKKVVGRAALGAIAGLIIGALSHDVNIGTSTAIGAGAGAAWGLGSAAMEQGTDAEIPVYTQMTLKLTTPVNVILQN